MPVIIDDDAAFVDGGVVGCRVKSGEDVVLVRDDGAHQLDDVRLVLDLVAVGRHRQQRRTETDRQVVRVHHVLVAELRQTAAQHDAIARNKLQLAPPPLQCVQTINFRQTRLTALVRDYPVPERYNQSGFY